MFELAILWIVLSGLVAYWASTRGHSAGPYFLIAFLASPLIAAALLVIQEQRRKRRRLLMVQPRAMSSCPYCDAPVRPQALLCGSCGRDLQKFRVASRPRMQQPTRLRSA